MVCAPPASLRIASFVFPSLWQCCSASPRASQGGGSGIQPSLDVAVQEASTAVPCFAICTRTSGSPVKLPWPPVSSRVLRTWLWRSRPPFPAWWRVVLCVLRDPESWARFPQVPLASACSHPLLVAPPLGAGLCNWPSAEDPRVHTEGRLTSVCLGVLPPRARLSELPDGQASALPYRSSLRTSLRAPPSMANEEDDPVVQEVTAAPRLPTPRRSFAWALGCGRWAGLLPAVPWPDWDLLSPGAWLADPLPPFRSRTQRLLGRVASLTTLWCGACSCIQPHPQHEPLPWA